jgi:hypothetical protein
MRSVLCALLLLPLLAVQPARGAEKLTVTSAWVNVRGAVFEVNARIVYPVDERMREALADGVTVHFDLQAVVEKESRYWFDTELVDVILRRALSWNALTQRFDLKEEGRSELSSFGTLEAALAAAGEVVNWPVVVETQLDPEANYRIRVRTGYRRGSLSLQALLPWSDGWNRRSEWSSWILPR